MTPGIHPRITPIVQVAAQRTRNSGQLHVVDRASQPAGDGFDIF